MKNYLMATLLLLLALNLKAQKIIATPITAAAQPVQQIAISPVIAFKANATFIGGEPIATATAQK